MGPWPQRPALRFRVYVARRVVAEEWAELTTEAAAASVGEMIGERQIALTERAQRAGLEWLVEVYDPGAAEAEAYLRFGTDRGMMTRPVKATPEMWQDMINVGSFTCPACGMVSYNASDIAEGYCARCHSFTGGGPA